MISVSAAVNTLLTLVVAGLIFWLLYWLLTVANPPEPFHKIGRVVLAVLAVLCCVALLLSLVGGQPVFRP